MPEPFIGVFGWGFYWGIKILVWVKVEFSHECGVPTGFGLLFVGLCDVIQVVL